MRSLLHVPDNFRSRRLVLVLVLLLVLVPSPVPAEESAPPSFIKGVTVSCQTDGREWATPEMAKTLDELKSLGVNSIAIHPYAQIQEDGHVRFRNNDNFRHIAQPLDWARERGLSVMLIPHIAYWGTKFLWRGEINFQTKEEWDRFFGDYQTWIVQMAKVAEAHGAQTFCIGLEFTFAQKFDARWRKIIAAVREVYHGKLTYGGNWDTFEEVTFGDAVDYIGVLAYFPLTKTSNPSSAEIADAWQRNASSWSLIRRRTRARNSSSSRSATTPARAPRPSLGPSRPGARMRTPFNSAASRWRSICPGIAPRSRECIGGSGFRNCPATKRRITGSKPRRSRLSSPGTGRKRHPPRPARSSVAAGVSSAESDDVSGLRGSLVRAQILRPTRPPLHFAAEFFLQFA